MNNVPIIAPGVPVQPVSTNEIIAPVANVQNSTILTAKDIRDGFLYGIPTSNYLGQVLSDDTIRIHCDAATAWLETELQISIRQRYWQQERHDYDSETYANFGFLHLYHYPILQISEFLCIYPDTNQTISFPLVWCQVDMEGIQNTVRLVPGVGSASSFIIGMGNNLLPLIFKTCGYVPDLFKISYYSGFPNNKVPAQITQIIGKKVAIDILVLASNAILAQGVISQSLSIDGMSQSATKIPFMYREIVALYRKQIEEEISSLRCFYNGIHMTVA
jgi:hypothetical protein